MSEPNFNYSHKPLEEEVDTLKESDKVYFEKVKPRLENIEARNRLYEEAIKRRVNVDDIFSHITTKRDHLERIMGYKGLDGPNGSIPLNSCTDARIGKAYKKAFYSADKAKK